MQSIILASVSAIAFASYHVVARVYSIHTKNARAYSIIWGSLCVLILLPFIPFFIGEWRIEDVPKNLVVAMLIASCFYSLYDRTQFAVRKYLEASEAALLSQISPVASLLTLWIFLGEEPTVSKILAAVLIITGNIVVMMPNGGRRVIFRKGTILGVFSFGALGIALAIDKLGSSGFPIPIYAALVYGLPVLVNITTPPLSVKTMKDEAHGILGKLFVLAALNVIGAFGFLFAFRTGEGGKVLLIVSTASLLSVLMGIVLLKERDHLLRKLIATVFVGVGIWLLV